MIKINLAKRKRAAFLSSDNSASGGGLQELLARINISPSDLQELPLVKIGLTIVAMIGSGFIVDFFQQARLDEVSAELQKLNQEQITLRKEAAKIAGYEPIKKQLEADEFTIRTKIETIQKLVSSRNEMARLLSNISTLIPEEIWLNELDVAGEMIRIKGKSIGIGRVSDFLKNLRKSVFFKDLVLDGTNQVTDPLGLELAEFTISGKKSVVK